MAATLLADAILFLHLLLAALMAAGLVLVPLGARLQWNWVRLRWLRLTQVGLMIFIALEALLGVACPLTVLEYTLRDQRAPTHFLAEWMAELLYWNAPVEAFMALYLLCALWLLALWRIVPPKPPKPRKPRRAGDTAALLPALENARRQVVLTLTAMSLAPSARSNEPNWQVGQMVQPPPLELLSGETVQWPALKGRLVLIEFWASWCPFCARQNPLLDSFYRRHQARGLEVITVSLDKTKDTAERYMAKGRYSFKAGMATPAWRSISSQRKGLPQLFVIDRRGILVAAEVREMMDDDIEELTKWL